MRHHPVLDGGVMRYRRRQYVAVQRPLAWVAQLQVALFVLAALKTAFVQQPVMVPAELHEVVEAGLTPVRPEFEGFHDQGTLLGRKPRSHRRCASWPAPWNTTIHRGGRPR